jgi:nicotinamide-nucleotide amidase
MKGEIIAIGDELLAGRVPNTTSLFAARRFFEAGYVIRKMSIVGDHPESIEEGLVQAMQKADFVIVTGGLGPTSDDLTTEVTSHILGRRLVFHNGIKERIEKYFQAKGEKPCEEYLKLAWLPEGATLLDETGKAAGYFLEHEGKFLCFLPGVPEQMQDLLDRKVLPYLATKWRPFVFTRQEVIKTFGLVESEINARCADLEEIYPGLKIGYYPDVPEVHVTLTFSGETMSETGAVLSGAKAELEARLYPHVFGYRDDTMEKVVGDLLRAGNLTLSVAESCTGGLIGHRLTSVPGSSDYFERGVITYSNLSKVELLNVSEETLAAFGAVSARVAEQMALGVKEKSRTDIGLSVTGIAGPAGGTPEKPVGTVYIGLAVPGNTVAHHFLFRGTREMIQKVAAETALDGLRRYLAHDTLVFGS